ncbi:hypothetical protein G4B88_013200 [Cannabis sativa]|uniref:Myb/SANT-like domain-containing protein n=1 Tax=Cannabis sativa TaxID=3483 RepID=A0A7J6GZJ6_CANSA|nr:hypothetical protein G4B88_013200 [Cannabis sativa]
MTGTDSEVVIIDNSEASVWPEKHEEIFIELMEEEVLKGNRNTTTFTKQSWKRIKEELYAQAKRISLYTVNVSANASENFAFFADRELVVPIDLSLLLLPSTNKSSHSYKMAIVFAPAQNPKDIAQENKNCFFNKENGVHHTYL